MGARLRLTPLNPCGVVLSRLRGLLFFLNPLIDVRRGNDASYRLMRSGCDLHSLGKFRLRKLLGLAFSRECFCLSRPRGNRPLMFRRVDRNEPAIGDNPSSHDGRC